MCRACEGFDKPMNLKEAEKYLKKINNWKLIDNGKAIEKEFSFKDFKEALEFVNKIGEIAEKEGHHPDINLHSYKKVRVKLWTHAIKGLSENDFIEAAKIDAI
ncbi:4a-hydroxytetrahydrobiopterin dehydratase [Candidatus Pacearchaeota archaeon]|nr:4a-hydroxytetrahydrobiopterin dehydratase [Candidatus Pacearchaeota archaeon]